MTPASALVWAAWPGGVGLVVAWELDGPRVARVDTDGRFRGYGYPDGRRDPIWIAPTREEAVRQAVDAGLGATS